MVVECMSPGVACGLCIFVQGFDYCMFQSFAQMNTFTRGRRALDLSFRRLLCSGADAGRFVLLLTAAAAEDVMLSSDREEGEF